MKINFKKTLVSPTSSVNDCIKKINKLKFKCLIVVDKNDVLLGSLTDGDIRRAILKNKKIYNSNIKNIYYKKTFFVKENNFSKTKVLRKIKDKNLIIVPVLNSQKKVIKILNTDNLKTKKTIKKNNLPEIPIIIMAGGKGKRLSPFTNILPKPLIPIKNKTALELIIENYTNQNQSNFYLSVNYKSEIIKAYFKELKPKYKLNFIEETKPLGTAGSLYLLKNKISKSFIVCNCDIIVNYNLEDFYNFHEKNKNDITILSSINNYKIPYGSLTFDKNNNFEKIAEKPSFKKYINIGVYLLSKNVLKIFKNNQFLNITDLINNSKKNNFKVNVFKISSQKWKDIGEWNKYNNYIKNINND